MTTMCLRLRLFQTVGTVDDMDVVSFVCSLLLGSMICFISKIDLPYTSRRIPYGIRFKAYIEANTHIHRCNIPRCVVRCTSNNTGGYGGDYYGGGYGGYGGGYGRVSVSNYVLQCNFLHEIISSCSLPSMFFNSTEATAGEV